MYKTGRARPRGALGSPGVSPVVHDHPKSATAFAGRGALAQPAMQPSSPSSQQAHSEVPSAVTTHEPKS